MRSVPRYDGHAQWYDQWRAAYIADNAADIARLLGPGDGLCLDLGCGTGLLFPALAGTGRDVIGLDMSADQLRFARRRSRQVIRADGSVLPFASAVFATVVASWISTDVNDFGAVLAEATRVLRPGGTFLFYGAHPCFNGPHIEWLDDGGVRAHPRYRDAGWHAESPWWGFQVRRRVGMRHHPLAEILNAFIAVGLALDHVTEAGPRAVPNTLSIRARKPLTLRKTPQPRHGQHRHHAGGRRRRRHREAGAGAEGAHCPAGRLRRAGRAQPGKGLGEQAHRPGG
jgi:SAM-dependent methyltransferase